jgi:hypothetical protein
LPILRIVAFDGTAAYAFTDRELLRVSHGAVESLHTTSAQIRSAQLSPCGEYIVWLEKARRPRGYVSRVQTRLRPTAIQVREYCYDACWLTSTEILALELHHAGDAESGQSLHRCGLNGEVEATSLRTDDYALRFGPSVGETRRVILFGYRLSPLTAVGKPTAGAWSFDVPTGVSRCLANATPAGGTAATLEDGCLFADATAQTSESSRLVFASHAGCRVAQVPAFLRDFALMPHGSSVLFRVVGEASGIAELSLDKLTKSDRAA